MPVPTAFEMLYVCAIAYFTGAFLTALSVGAKEGYDTPRQSGRLTRILMSIMFIAGLFLGAWLQ